MKIAKIVLLVLTCIIHFTSLSQNLKAGFDKTEYIELLKAYSRWGDSNFYAGIEKSKKFKQVYRAPVVGLDNCWELYKSEDNIAVISIRGTTKNATSWLVNMYAAMAPAKGSIHLSDSLEFSYELAKDSKAAVHVGWLIATAFLSPDIIAKIESNYQTGTKDFIIMGHSQGGAIAYLLTSHLRQLQESGKLPKDVRFKTYCSAAPKPGNLYYAYEYEHQTAGGWSYNVVNTVDWVPETPISIQTIDDFNNTNPLGFIDVLIKKQKFPKKLLARKVYNQLTKHPIKAQKKYEKYLGDMASKFVTKQYPQFKAPEYYNSNNYVRVGTFIILKPDESYYQNYPENSKQYFTHHGIKPYILLAEKLPL